MRLEKNDELRAEAADAREGARAPPGETGLNASVSSRSSSPRTRAAQDRPPSALRYGRSSRRPTQGAAHPHRAPEKRLRRPRAKRPDLPSPRRQWKYSTGRSAQIANHRHAKELAEHRGVQRSPPHVLRQHDVEDRSAPQRYANERNWNAGRPPSIVSTWTRAALSASRSGKAAFAQMRRGDAIVRSQISESPTTNRMSV